MHDMWNHRDSDFLTLRDCFVCRRKTATVLAKSNPPVAQTLNQDEVYVAYGPFRGYFVDYLGLDHPIAVTPGEYVIYRNAAMKDADYFGLKALVGKLHGNSASTWPADPIALRLPVYSRHITPGSNLARSLQRSGISNQSSSLHHLYLIVAILPA
jgi:hypothetical protein